MVEVVIGVEWQGAKSEMVYFPGNEAWYDIKSGATFPGGKELEIPVTLDSGIPVYQRAGSIIPKKLRHRRSSTQMQNDPYTLVCFHRCCHFFTLKLPCTFNEARGENLLCVGRASLVGTELL